MLGTTPRTLRFYEEEGLMVSYRTKGGTRLYSKADIARFRIILKLAKLGISLNDIKRLATARPGSITGAEASRKVSALLEVMQAEITQQKALYEVLEKNFKNAYILVQQCRRCRNVPSPTGCPNCPLNETLDKAELLYLIWEQNLG